MQEAVRLGLTENTMQSGRKQGDGGVKFGYEIVGKTNPAVGGEKPTHEVLQVSRIDLKTNKREMVFEKPEYRAEKKRLKINEYKEK